MIAERIYSAHVSIRHPQVSYMTPVVPFKGKVRMFRLLFIYLDFDATIEDESPTFIYEPSRASDLCLHPSLVHLHGSLSAAHTARGARLSPEFVFGKMPLGSEILLPDLAVCFMTNVAVMFLTT